MIELDKAFRDTYWWVKQGTVLIDPESVESIEQIYGRTPGGSDTEVYTLITTKTGTQHRVMGDVRHVSRKLGLND